MAELKLTALQQRFFLAVLEGKTPGDAFKAARAPVGLRSLPTIKDSTARSEASKLMRRPAIARALARAHANLQAKIELRVEDLVDQLLETRDIALRCDPPQASASVAATMGVAKLLGLVIDRTELNVTRNKPSLLPTKTLELSEDEWRSTFDPASISKPPKIIT